LVGSFSVATELLDKVLSIQSSKNLLKRESSGFDRQRESERERESSESSESNQPEKSLGG
jgi:hypothetical protein